MTRLLYSLVVIAIAVPLSFSWSSPGRDAASADDKARAKSDGPMIGHMVYFKLKDSSPAAKQKLVDACKKYLSGRDGTIFFSAGVIADEFQREVNDRDWDVALHLVFVNKAAHDKYQDHPEHLKFIAETRDTWSKVRVFDSALVDYLANPKK